MAQDGKDSAVARAMALEGLEAYEAGDYAEALRLFSNAEELVHAPPHLLYMARAHKELGHPVEAFELYNRVVREKLSDEDPDAFLRAQKEAAQEIPSVEPLIAQVTVHLEGPGAEYAVLLVDGEKMPPALVGVKAPFNPGEHVLSVTGDGVEAEPQTIQVEPGGSAEFTLHVAIDETARAGKSGGAARPEDAGGKKKVPAYVAFGVGGAGAVVGAVFTILYFDQASQADTLFDDAGCAAGCSASEQQEVMDLDQSAATSGTLALVGYGVAVAGAATGLTLLLLDGKSGSEERKIEAGVRPYVGFGQVGVTGRF